MPGQARARIGLGWVTTSLVWTSITTHPMSSLVSLGHKLIKSSVALMMMMMFASRHGQCMELYIRIDLCY